MTLPFILLVGGIIVEIAIAGSFVAYFLSTSGYGERLSVRANAAAHSGIRDALVRVSQNKEFTAATCANPYSYSFPIEQDSVVVTVCRSEDFGSSKYIYQVTSVGSAGSQQKKLSGRIIVDTITGRTQLESISEQAIEE